MLTDKGPVIGDPSDIATAITIANENDRNWTTSRFVLAFGAYGWTRLLVYANGIEDALDEAIDWIAEHAPGLLCNEQVAEEYKRAIAEGLDEEAAQQRAEEDTTSGGNAGDYILSYEWSIVAEDPTREELLALAGVQVKKSGKKAAKAA